PPAAIRSLRPVCACWRSSRTASRSARTCATGSRRSASAWAWALHCSGRTCAMGETQFKLQRAGELALVTIDNGEDHSKPSTFGRAALESLSATLDELER